MINQDWRQAEPALVEATGDEILITKAAEHIAECNSTITAGTILVELMRTYWREDLTLFELKQPEHCDEYMDEKVIQRPARDSTTDDPIYCLDEKEFEVVGRITIKRARVEWPRAKLTFLLWGNRSEYRPTDETYRSLALLDQINYLIIHDNPPPLS